MIILIYMPAQPVSVNLLDQPEFRSTSIARIMNWAITYGRYIMIGTEVIVLVAFISRFSLDRRLTDQREEIAQKQIILEANQDFEEEYRYIQDTFVKVNSLLQTQEKPVSLLYEIISVLPADVRITSYYYDGKSIDMKLLSGTTESFSSFLNTIKTLSSLKHIEVTEITKDNLRGTEFKILATTQ